MIVIYGKDNCYWCQEAKKIANQYELEYEYKNITNESYRTQMFNLYPEAKTVPQIWWNDRRIGGYDEFIREIENTLGNYGQGAF